MPRQRAAATGGGGSGRGGDGNGPRRPAPRPVGSNRPRSRAHQARRWILVIAAAMALLVGGVVAWGVAQFANIDRVDVDLESTADLEPQNFLVVGSDTRDLGDEETADAGGIYGNAKERPPGGKRADTIVVARIDPREATIELLSVPRDLWVDGGTRNEGRINSAYNEGPQNLVDTIERNLGIPINHYVEVNFNGFKGLVDALGGVPMYFDRPVRDSNTGLSIRKAGCYTLDGVQALAFARSRHLVYSNGVKWISDQTGDLGRITRQQVFLRHALAKVTTLGLDDLNSLRVLTGVATNNVTIDDSLGTDDLIRLARKFSSFDASTMIVHRLTTSPFRTKRGADVLRVAEQESRPVLDIFAGKTASAKAAAPATTVLAPAAVTVDVLNGVKIGGLAAKGAADLEKVGFKIGKIGDTTGVKATTVFYGPGTKAQADLVASKISPTPAVKEDSTLSGGKVVVKLVAELNVPAAVTAPSSTAAAGSAVSSAPTTVPTSGAGTATPEKTLGLNIGDPPPGVSCG